MSLGLVHRAAEYKRNLLFRRTGFYARSPSGRGQNSCNWAFYNHGTTRRNRPRNQTLECTNVTVCQPVTPSLSKEHASHGPKSPYAATIVPGYADSFNRPMPAIE